MARGFSRGGGGGGRSGGSGGGFSFGGGSRSSGGGGFSFGRSSSSSSRSHDRYDDHHHYHRPRRPRGPWHIPMFGRTVVVSTGARSIFSFLIVVFAIACFMLVIFGRFTAAYNTDIKEQKLIIEQYETRDKDYKKLIANAKDGEAGFELQTFDITPYYNAGSQTFTYTIYSGSYDPTTPGIYDMDFYRDGQEYFFIVYEYVYAAPGASPRTYTDWTFAQYTKYQLEDIIKVKGGKIEIAVGWLTGTASNDDGLYAMNTDYSLEANQEYNYEVYLLDDYKSSRNGYLFASIGAGLVIAGILAGVVIYLVRKWKVAQKKEELENKKTEAEIAEAEAKAEVAEAEANKVNRFCMYCGNPIPDGGDVCPTCGSRQFEKED